MAQQNPTAFLDLKDDVCVCHRYNEEKATSPFSEWSPVLFEILEDVVESLINGGFQTLADDVIQHLLEDAFLLLPLLLFLVAHFFTLLSITRLMGSSSSSFWCLAL